VERFVNVVIDDPDGIMRAKAAGATIVMGPKDTPFGALLCGPIEGFCGGAVNLRDITICDLRFVNRW
jgi:hypothetical protein